MSTQLHLYPHKLYHVLTVHQPMFLKLFRTLMIGPPQVQLTHMTKFVSQIIILRTLIHSLTKDISHTIYII